jgi:CheY-like chemotaxis protein
MTSGDRTQAASPEKAPAHPRTVLLVQDDPDSRTIYAAILQHHGFRVLEAIGGEEGVQLAREQGPDLVLMDISMPGLDGWNATKLLKQDPRTASIPVVALTAHALKRDRAKARDIGFDSYLVKPVDPTTVVNEVVKLIGPSNPPSREPRSEMGVMSARQGERSCSRR